MNKLTIDVLRKIGQFFLERNQNDYAKTEQYLVSMRVTNVQVFSDEVIITLRRPGLLIGKRGELIEGLTRYLKTEIRIVEEEAFDFYFYLIPEETQIFYEGQPIEENGNPIEE